MGTKIVCFYIEPSDTAVESLRRYVHSTEAKCAGLGGYHDASVNIGVVPWTEKFHGCSDIASDELRLDARWPLCCSCGYEFKSDDQWQHSFKQRYVDEATGYYYTLHEAPPGAMWNADWMKDHIGPDGIALCVRLPNKIDWLVDGPNRNADGSLGPGWTRSGTLPKVTARPSIFSNQGAQNQWHGYLTDGILEEC